MSFCSSTTTFHYHNEEDPVDKYHTPGLFCIFVSIRVMGLIFNTEESTVTRIDDQGINLLHPWHTQSHYFCCYCFSVTRLCPTICKSTDCKTLGFPVLHCLPAFAQTHVHLSPSNHIILCHSFLLLSSIFLSISMFSSELAFHFRW